MRKIYPIRVPIEIRDYNKDDDIFDSDIPKSIYDEMKKISERGNVPIREMTYERKLYFCVEDCKWIDNSEIYYEKTKNNNPKEEK